MNVVVMTKVIEFDGFNRVEFEAVASDQLDCHPPNGAACR